MHDVTDGDIRAALKFASGILEYPEMKGIPIDQIDTHSLRSGGADALSLWLLRQGDSKNGLLEEQHLQRIYQQSTLAILGGNE